MSSENSWEISPLISEYAEDSREISGTVFMVSGSFCGHGLFLVVMVTELLWL